MDQERRTRLGAWGANRSMRALGWALAVALGLLLWSGPAVGQQLSNPLNDVFALGQGSGDNPAQAPIVTRQEPPFVATPLAPCRPGDHKEPSVDGRVPEGSADGHGLNCNVDLMFPLNAFNPGAGSTGVAVLDMSDPAHPKLTDTLRTVPMLSPHESLNLNAKRGLLAAVNGNLRTYPGYFSLYDVHDDCRHPVLDADGPYARFGHESGFSPDGKTFYATSTALKSITALDVTDPKNPHVVWYGQIESHGMSLSDDGNRAYIADVDGNMLTLDVSQIQARKPDPKTREISRLTWHAASIPQNAIPFTENGHPYILEFDEYTQGTDVNQTGDPNMVGAGRIIDNSDETKPFVLSNLRLQIDQPAEHAEAAHDPGADNRPQGYAAHYCNIPTRVDPKIVACSFIASGLRLFDISDLKHPKEIGHFVAPPEPRSENGYTDSDFMMAQPTFAPERREVWVSDGTSGFYVLRVDKSVWPQGATPKRTARHLKRSRHGHRRRR